MFDKGQKQSSTLSCDSSYCFSVHMFVCLLVQYNLRQSFGYSFSSCVYLIYQWPETIHLWTKGTL